MSVYNYFYYTCKTVKNHNNKIPNMFIFNLSSKFPQILLSVMMTALLTLPYFLLKPIKQYWEISPEGLINPKETVREF